MTDRIDHAAEAGICINYARQSPSPDPAQLGMLQAQVHATLAVAEQLRVANLIALAGYEHADGSRGYQNVINHAVNAWDTELNQEVKEVLNIA